VAQTPRISIAEAARYQIQEPGKPTPEDSDKLPICDILSVSDDSVMLKFDKLEPADVEALSTGAKTIFTRFFLEDTAINLLGNCIWHRELKQGVHQMNFHISFVSDSDKVLMRQFMSLHHNGAYRKTRDREQLRNKLNKMTSSAVLAVFSIAAVFIIVFGIKLAMEKVSKEIDPFNVAKVKNPTAALPPGARGNPEAAIIEELEGNIPPEQAAAPKKQFGIDKNLIEEYKKKFRKRP